MTKVVHMTRVVRRPSRRLFFKLVGGGGLAAVGLRLFSESKPPSVNELASNYPSGQPTPLVDSFSLRFADRGIFPKKTELIYSLAVLGANTHSRVLFRDDMTANYVEGKNDPGEFALVHAAQVGLDHLGPSIERIRVPLVVGTFTFPEDGTYEVGFKNIDSPMSFVTKVRIGPPPQESQS